jgi:YD repeat-containing protein
LAKPSRTADRGRSSLAYDPLGRLRTTLVTGSPSTTTTFLYAGEQLVAEYNNSGALTVRYAFACEIDPHSRTQPGGISAAS